MVEKLSEEQITEFRRVFSIIDKDKDGKITSKELGTLMKSIGKKPSDKELKSMIEAVDADKNGAIDFQEFIAMISHTVHLLSTEVSDDSLREAFSVFDKDSDGYITHSELKEVLTSLGEKLSDEEVEEMIFEADADRDGKLSYEEFVGLMKSK